MDKWTPEGTLERIDRYKVTTSHMVPTMFHRLLQLPEEERASYDVSSLRVRHPLGGAVPGPDQAADARLVGPGRSGSTTRPPRAAARSASPQRLAETSPARSATPGPAARSSILDDDGNELPHGQIGTVWMKMGDRTFEYHGDPEKTKKSWNEQGFFTVGDAGEMDEDGFLFLRDRKIDMIIAGGVNIYPAETESVLLQHPKVDDAAVFGIPDDDAGEQIKADGPAGRGRRRRARAREGAPRATASDNLAKFKVPRSIDFLDDFPRDPNGKLYKRKLRDPYWAGRASQLV